MAGINTSLLIVVTMFAVTVICLENDTVGASDAGPKEPKPSGLECHSDIRADCQTTDSYVKRTKIRLEKALASLGRMIVDVPLGVVEAFKDGAEVIESVVLAIVRGIFT